MSELPSTAVAPAVRVAETRARLGLFYALLLATLALLLGVVFRGTVLRPGPRLEASLLIVGIGLVALLPPAYNLARRRFEILDLGQWFATYFFLNYGLRGIYDLVYGSPILVGLSDQAQAVLLTRALAASAVGLLAFRLAYASDLGRRIQRLLPEPPARWSEPRFVWLAAALLAVGWSIRIAYVQFFGGGLAGWISMNKFEFLGEVQGVTYVNILGSLTVLVLFGFFLMGRSRGRRRYWLLLAAALVPELLFQVFSGVRKGILVLLLGLFIGRIHTGPRGHRASVRSLRTLVLLVLVILTAFPVLTRMRAGSYTAADLLNTIPTLLKYPEQALHMQMGRQFSLDSAAVILQARDEGAPLTWGRELLLVPVAWVPRVLWPDKPTISLGKRLYQEYFPQIYNEGTAVSVGVIGNCYWAFGYAGVVLGLMLTGVAWRTFNEWLVVRRDNLSASLLLMTVFPVSFFFVEQHVLRLLMDDTFQLFLAAGFVWLLAARRREPV